MNRIEEKFRELQKLNKRAFIAYIMAGDPDLKTTYDLVLELERRGVDIIELGVPFSDPIADGPTIQRAGQRALANNINLSQVLSLVLQLRRKTGIPIILMSYFNIFFRYGLKKFILDAKKNGVDGVIVPDLIPEEAGDLIGFSRANDFSTIFLASPTSTQDRLKKIVSVSEGFIYYVSLTGVTGAREKLPKNIIDDVKKIKSLTKKPVCVGFGISRPSQVKEITRIAEGVVVGSVIIDVIEKMLHRKDLVEKVGNFVKFLLSNTQ